MPLRLCGPVIQVDQYPVEDSERRVVTQRKCRALLEEGGIMEDRKKLFMFLCMGNYIII